MPALCHQASSLLILLRSSSKFYYYYPSQQLRCTSSAAQSQFRPFRGSATSSAYRPSIDVHNKTLEAPGAPFLLIRQNPPPNSALTIGRGHHVPSPCLCSCPRRPLRLHKRRLHRQRLQRLTRRHAPQTLAILAKSGNPKSAPLLPGRLGTQYVMLSFPTLTIAAC